MTASLGARLLLAERYVELGLLAAAKATLERTIGDYPDGEEEVLDALIRVHAAAGDGRAARDAAARLATLSPGPDSRVRLGEAQLAAGERDAARFAFAAALEASGPQAPSAIRALLGRAMVAAAEDDHAGAGAAAMTALDSLLDGLALDDNAESFEVAAAIPQIERAIEIICAADRTSDLEKTLGERDDAALPVPIKFLLALASASSGGSDAEIAALLEAACHSHPQFLPARLRKIEIGMRRRHRDESARRAAAEELEALASDLESGEVSSSAALAAAVQLSLATIYDDEPSLHDKAVAAYERGLALRPGQLTAATRLAELAFGRGDRDAALDSAVSALRIDGGSHLGWLAAARACGVPGRVDATLLSRLLEAASPSSGRSADAAARLVAAAIEVARADLLAGMHARGHRVKNLLGIVGSRARRARKAAADSPLGARLVELENELTGLYDEWSNYLRSMHAEGPTFETVDLTTILAEVATAARSRGQIDVKMSVKVERGVKLPPVRADRVLLGEALSNLAGNAVDACEQNGGRVSINARLRSAEVIEVTFDDSGPGISPADLARVLAPGFTTKTSGSGLGLAIAERVVRAHRGRLLIDSEQGRGTIITVLLPTEPPSVALAKSGEGTR